MRGFLVVVVLVALGVLYYKQKHSEPAPDPAKTVASEPARTGAQPAAPRQEAVTQPQPLSEHNWMKRSLDRATEVRNQAREQTRDSQNP